MDICFASRTWIFSASGIYFFTRSSGTRSISIGNDLLAVLCEER